MLKPTPTPLAAAQAAVAARLRALLQTRNFAVFVHDVVMAGAAFVLAFYLRLGDRALDWRHDILIMALAFSAVRAVDRNPASPFAIVGIVSNQTGRIGQVIHGVEVLGGEDELPELVRGLDVRGLKPDKLVIVGSAMKGADVQRLLALAEKAGCQ